MAEGFITRKGGVAATKTPTINFVSKTDTEIVFTITNNDAATVDIFWEVDDNTPDANQLSLAGETTSGNITASNLDDDTEYTIFTFANAASKAGSATASLTVTTDEPSYYLSFDGVDDYVDLDNLNFSLDENPVGSIELTVEILSSGGPDAEFIVGARDGGTDTRFYILTRNSNLEIYLGDGAGNFNPISINLNQIYDMRLEWNNGNASFYLDNTLIQNFTYAIGSGDGSKQYKLGNVYSSTSRYGNLNLYSYKHTHNGTDFIVWDNSQDSGTNFVNSAGTNGTIVGATWEQE